MGINAHYKNQERFIGKRPIEVKTGISFYSSVKSVADIKVEYYSTHACSVSCAVPASSS